MAKIFSSPDGIKPPKFNFGDITGSKKDEDRYVNELKEWCKTNSPEESKFVGETIRIPHADGYAQYTIFSTKPPQLIHNKIGDEWDSPHADLLTGKRIKEMITQEKRLSKLFSKA